MKKIAFSGTLDPITNGHMWVIGEARALADEVVVLISENPVKAPQFSAVIRKEIVEQRGSAGLEQCQRPAHTRRLHGACGQAHGD